MRDLTPLQDRPVEVRGKAPWATRVDAALPQPPFTVLCRTNAGVVGAVVTTHEVHRGRVHVVGGVEELVHLLRDAALLKKGEGRTDPHPDLVMVETWEELEALAAYLKERRRRALGLKVLERVGKGRVAGEAHRLLEEGRRDRP